MSDQSPHVKATKEPSPSQHPQTLRFDTTLFQCPGESQPIDRAIHLARLERCYPKCSQCKHREDVGPVSARLYRGIRTILSESEPILPDRFAIVGVESELSDTTRFGRWAAEFGLYLRNQQQDRFREGQLRDAKYPHVVLADASARTVPALVAAVSAGLRWAGCDVTDLGRGAVGMLNFASRRLEADAGLLLAQPGQWEHECGISAEGASEEFLKETVGNEEVAQEEVAQEEVARFSVEDFPETEQASGDSLPMIDRPTRRLGRLQRTSLTELYLESFACRYHGLRPLRITLYTSCVPVVDALRRLTAPFDVQLEVLPYSVALREGDAVDLFGAHFSVYIDGTGRVVELLDEQGVPFFADLDDLSPDAVEVVTAVQVLLSRSDASLSELTFKGATLSHKKAF